MTSAIAIYQRGLLGRETTMITDRGTRHRLPIDRWSGRLTAADLALLDRCSGPTLDIGCGPGRLTAALHARGIAALGIDIAGRAVEIANQRGGVAVRRDVFSALPGEGRWSRLLLADGNIGIGGDPIRLLCRCRELLADDGRLLVDLAPPGTGYARHRVRLAHDDRVSAWFGWSWLDPSALKRMAEPAGLQVAEVWRQDGRWQAELVVSSGWRSGSSQ